MTAQATTKAPKTVLVIDDDEAILEAITLLLADAGYKVGAWPSYTGDLMGKGEPLPDIVLLDMLLSGQDGRDICRKLKKDPATASIPVIMMSAHPQAERSVFDEAPVDVFLAKPFEAERLLATIEAELAKAEAKKERQTEKTK